MNRTIIADASCLIALERIGKLEILQILFSAISITEEIKQEFGKNLPEWIFLGNASNLALKEELAKILDKGEASAIALALETENSLLIIDEKKGRKIAQDFKIDTIGTLRILLLAKQKGAISSLKEMIIELSKCQFRFSPAIVETLLKEAGEI